MSLHTQGHRDGGNLVRDCGRGRRGVCPNLSRDGLFSQQLFWWSLGIACLAVPAASILWKVGTVWMVGVITAVSLAISWITAIASASGMFFRDTLPVHPLAHFTAAIVATVALGGGLGGIQCPRASIEPVLDAALSRARRIGLLGSHRRDFRRSRGLPVDGSILCRYVSDANNGAIYAHGRGFLSR